MAKLSPLGSRWSIRPDRLSAHPRSNKMAASNLTALESGIMNPYRAVPIQAVGLSAAIVVAWWLGPNWFGPVAATCTLAMTAMAVGLATRYVIKLRGAEAVRRGPWRRTGDALVAGEVLLPTVTSVLVLLAGDHPIPSVFAGLEVSTFALMLSVLLSFVFGSSLWDWWHVLPERDGVVRLPPCMSSGDRRWTDVTATWITHRFIAEVAGAIFFLFLPLVIAAEVWYADPGELNWLTKAASPIALILGWMFGFSKVRIPIGLSTVIETPPIALGDTLTWRVPRQVGSKRRVNEKGSAARIGDI